MSGYSYSWSYTSSSSSSSSINNSTTRTCGKPARITYTTTRTVGKPVETVANAPLPQIERSTAATGGGTPCKATTPFEVAVLEEHNRLRAKHSAKPLKLNSQISRYAQEWANNLAARNTMYHRPNNKYGENLYACFGKANLTGGEAVRSWYDEIKYYRFGEASPSNFSQVGHFTQVVWKASTELGVGIAKQGTSTYVVCNYAPPGNLMGSYSANVTRS